MILSSYQRSLGRYRHKFAKFKPRSSGEQSKRSLLRPPSFRPDPAAVTLDKVLDDGQNDAGAFILPAARD